MSQTKIGTNELNGLVGFALRHHEILEEEYGKLEGAAEQAGDLLLRQQAHIDNLSALLAEKAVAHDTAETALAASRRGIADIRERNDALTIVVQNGNSLAHHARVLNDELAANWHLLRPDVKQRLAQFSANLGNQGCLFDQLSAHLSREHATPVPTACKPAEA